MSVVSLECIYIIERIRSIAFQVGAFLGDDCQYNRNKQARYIKEVLIGGGVIDIAEPISNTILYGQNTSVELESK